jgi:hypothetical protein
MYGSMHTLRTYTRMQRYPEELGRRTLRDFSLSLGTFGTLGTRNEVNDLEMAEVGTHVGTLGTLKAIKGLARVKVR